MDHMRDAAARDTPQQKCQSCQRWAACGCSPVRATLFGFVGTCMFEVRQMHQRGAGQLPSGGAGLRVRRSARTRVRQTPSRPSQGA